MIGVVDWFNVRKGYGFIINLDDDTRFFCHRTAITGEGYIRLFPGEFVSFETENLDDGKVQCKEVTGVNGHNLLCQNEKYTFKVYPRRRNRVNENDENDDNDDDDDNDNDENDDDDDDEN
jgi:cold shock CspA family protein